MQRETFSILFLDVVGYSKLTEPQLCGYFEKCLPELSTLFFKEKDNFVELNTWGDGIIAVTKDPYFLARLALDLRDYFKKKNWSDLNLPSDFSCRLALNAGVAFLGHDPLRNCQGIFGSQINLSARIEPITPPGEVWVTEPFTKIIDLNVDNKLAFDDQGETPLAKCYGSRHLYRLRWSHEPENPQLLITQQQAAPKPATEPNETIEPSATSTTTNDLIEEMIKAFHNSRLGEAEEKYKAINSLESNPTRKLEAEALFLYFRYTDANDGSALQSLRNLAGEKEVAEYAHTLIGRCYEKVGDYEKAALAYEVPAKEGKDEMVRAQNIVALARCQYNAGKKTKAFQGIMVELGKVKKAEAAGTLYRGLAWLYEKDEVPELRAMALEKAVEFAPNNTEIRFGAAYSYAKVDFQELSLTHYLILLDFDRTHDPASNNVAVQYDKLKMPIEAVNCFQKATTMGNTLAMANLANRYIKGGFFQEANEIIEKARKEENIHENVGHAVVALAQAKNAERELNAKISEKAQVQKRFVLTFAEAFFVGGIDSRSNFEGQWKSASGIELELHLNDLKDGIWANWVQDDQEFRLEGEVVNRGARIKYFEKDTTYAILGSLQFIETGHGFAYLSADHQNFMILLFGKKRYSDEMEQSLEVFNRMKK